MTGKPTLSWVAADAGGMSISKPSRHTVAGVTATPIPHPNDWHGRLEALMRTMDVSAEELYKILRDVYNTGDEYV